MWRICGDGVDEEILPSQAGAGVFKRRKISRIDEKGSSPIPCTSACVEPISRKNSGASDVMAFGDVLGPPGAAQSSAAGVKKVGLVSQSLGGSSYAAEGPSPSSYT